MDRKGRLIGIGQQMPPITTLIKTELDEESLYRILSAMAHAHPWAFQQLSFRQVTSDTYDPGNSKHNVQIHWLEKN